MPLEVPVETAGEGVESESASRLTFVLDVDLGSRVEDDVQTDSDFYAVSRNAIACGNKRSSANGICKRGDGNNVCIGVVVNPADFHLWYEIVAFERTGA